MPKRRRERSRSKTPEVPWELLLASDAPPPAPVLPNGIAPKKLQQQQQAVETGRWEEDGSEGVGNREEEARSRQPAPPVVDEDVPPERDAWRALVGRLLCLRGDPKTEALLVGRHPDLLGVADACGSMNKTLDSIDQAREAARPWFEKGLKGKRLHGTTERARLCVQLAKTLEERSAAILSEDGAGDLTNISRVLDRGHKEEEGPLICSLLARELVGSKYEGLWISRQSPGKYILGDDFEGSGLPTVDQDGAKIYPRVRTVVKVINNRLCIAGFFHEGEDDYLNPAKVPIGPFLSVYFEGFSLKQALEVWRDHPHRNGTTGNGKAANGGGGKQTAPPSVGGSGAVARNVDVAPRSEKSEQIRALEKTLPPGWEIRESRTKKGVYYYANPSKGTSQMERPKS